jgi:hypothetical protein
MRAFTVFGLTTKGVNHEQAMDCDHDNLDNLRIGSMCVSKCHAVLGIKQPPGWSANGRPGG